jgi:hypothetical protein
MAATPDLDQLLQRYATGRYRPATFLERGVSLPLTTPQLMGARIRPAQRKGLELVLPHPAGAEGVYILPWSALHDFCAPSLHDRALWDRVATLPLLTPGAVRQVARTIAAEGFAGRAAARAARAATAARQDGTAQTQIELLMVLIRQGEPPNNALPPPERDNPANIQLRVRGALRRRAELVHPTRALEVIEELALAYAICGLRPDSRAAPLMRLIAALRGLAEAVAAWAATRPPEEQRSAQLIVSATELTLRCAERSLTEARALTADIWDLLRRWDAEPDRVRGIASRPEWVLDGWDMLAGVWQAATAEARLDALTDMALLVPVIPAEARDWLGFDAESAMERHRGGLRTWRRTVVALQDWVTGRMTSRQRQGEALREACA